MPKKIILFRVDASSNLGTGHIERCKILATHLKKNFLIYFLTNNRNINLYKIKADKILIYNSSQIINFYKKNYYNQNICYFFDLNFDKINQLEKKCINIIKKKNKVIIYADNFKNVNEKNLTIIPYVIKNIKFKSKNLLIGPENCIFKKKIIEKSKKKIKKKNYITICFGGSDPNNLTNKVINQVKKIKLNKKKYKVIIIVGSLYNKNNLKKLKLIINQNINFKIYINPRNIYDLISKSTLNIINDGNLKYELSALKSPFILLSNNKKSHEFSKLFNQKFKCFFTKKYDNQLNNLNTQIISALNKKNLDIWNQHNFKLINLNSKNFIITRIKKFLKN